MTFKTNWAELELGHVAESNAIGILLNKLEPPYNIAFAAAAPTTGTHYLGDRVYNTVPVASGYEGWVCITAGTPGVWAGYGLIGLTTPTEETTDIIVAVNALKAALVNPSIAPGSRLLLRGGTYTEADMVVGLTGVTIMPYQGQTVILRPTSGYRVLTLDDDAHDVILDNLVVDGSYCVDGIKITGSASGITLRKLEVKNVYKNCTSNVSKAQGILVNTSDSTPTVVDGCYIHDNGLDLDYDHGLYLSSPAVVKDCVIRNNASNGIHVYSCLATDEISIYDNIVEGNAVQIGCYDGICTVFNNLCSMGTLGEKTINVRYNADADVFFNTCFGRMDVSGNITAAVVNVKDNVIVAANETITVESSDCTINADHNLMYSNTSHTLIDIIDAGGNLDVNETNTVNSNFTPLDGYHPLTGNPAIDAGVAIGGFGTDITEAARHTPPTIGAYEVI